MNDEPSSTDDEPCPPEAPEAGEGERREYVKVRRPFTNIAVELDTEELAQKGVQKMILAEISRLESDVAMLKGFETSFHERDKKCAVLESSIQKSAMVEILYTVSIAVGSALLGWLPSSTSSGASIMIAVLAVALLLFALLAKWKGAGE